MAIGMLTDEQLQTDIIGQVGDKDSILQRSIQVWWAYYADKADIDPRLQYLYVWRRAIQRMQAEVRNDVTVQVTGPAGGAQQILSDRFKFLQAMMAEVQSEITMVEETVQSGSGPVGGVIQTVVPPGSVPPCVGTVDANDPRLRGSPYYASGPWGRYP